MSPPVSPQQLTPAERQQKAYLAAKDCLEGMGKAMELVFDIDQPLEAGAVVALDLVVQLPSDLQDGFFHPLIIRVHQRVMAAVEALGLEPEINVQFLSIHENEADPIGTLRSVVERCDDNAAPLKLLDAAKKARG